MLFTLGIPKVSPVYPTIILQLIQETTFESENYINDNNINNNNTKVSHNIVSIFNRKVP